MKKSLIRSLSSDKLEEFLVENNFPKYRSKQILQWLWKGNVTSFAEMNNVPLPIRTLLENHFTIDSVLQDITQVSNDGTIKSRFELYDEYKVEGVLIPTAKRLTACVSSQVGCSLSCSFCATGKMKRMRNLSAGEIYDQVMEINRQAMHHYQTRLTNIVFMGMGEPLLNFNNVMTSIDRLTDDKGWNFGSKRITISTAGIGKMIERMADHNAKVKLALSLHAADDIKRNKIMPINEQNNLNTLTKSLMYYYSTTKMPITFEYILFNNFNDGKEDIKNLARICRKIPSKINIIQYNPVEGVELLGAKDQKLDWFQDQLKHLGVSSTVRRSRGKDIDAACGQLANQ